MEGTQEALSGKMRLLFTPAARTSLLMLRLNEAALRALQECQQQQVRPVIAFQGHRGYLRLPGPGWSCLFSFIVSQCGQEGSSGGLDLVYQRLGRSGPNCLHCLGSLRERLTIWAAMDTIPAPLLAQEHLTEDPRESESWQDTGDESEGHPQRALEEVSDPLASNHGQSLPGSSSEPLAQWEVRNHTYLPNREQDQPLPSPASQKCLDKKRSAPITTEEPEEKRPRALPLVASPLQGLSNQESQEGGDWVQDEDGDRDSRLEQSLSVQAASESPSPEEVPDYLLQYRAIHSAEQQQAYEQDFETDYAEYRILHARVGAASQRFTELGAEIKRLQRGTPEHKVLEDKIVQEYKKFRKVSQAASRGSKVEVTLLFDKSAFSLQRYPSYREEKHRCEYLHQKLSHIKGLILEFEEKNRGS
ncbi:RNA polymerase II elongation factor ELL3 isoform X1 [Peromyscus californicus insignis]|uniref:RNA polymerase II elongation factor ELL3 isoform X1 n=1 Tax=Peromyscus californicus insignis TaxID=564181 RepID=UPI0022A746A1|nr:RNA polymerase II elongation factor ELL3 isoform X1 [Peromyscus californicus insignis]